MGNDLTTNQKERKENVTRSHTWKRRKEEEPHVSFCCVSLVWNQHHHVLPQQESIACLQWRSWHFMHSQMVIRARIWGIITTLHYSSVEWYKRDRNTSSSSCKSKDYVQYYIHINISLTFYMASTSDCSTNTNTFLFLLEKYSLICENMFEKILT